MMKIQRVKTSLVLLLIMICIGLLVGCSSNTSEQPAPSASASSSMPKATPSNDSTEKQKVPNEKAILDELIQKGQTHTEMSYTSIITGQGISSESKVWLKEKKMKTDTTMNGQRVISIFDLSNGEILSYQPNTADSSTAIKMKFEEYQGLDHISPTDYLYDLDKDKFILTGTATVNGMECKVVLLTHGDNQVKLWISIESGLVVRIEDKFGDHITMFDFRDIHLGSGSVPENSFSLPQGMEVMDVNQQI